MQPFDSTQLTVVEDPAPGRPGVGVYEFGDEVSVFGYGPMPDRVPGRGEALCRIAEAQLALLEESGIETHLQRRIGATRLECTLLSAPGAAPAGAAFAALPVRAVFRRLLVAESSVFARLEAGELDPAALGLAAAPAPGEELPRTAVELATGDPASTRWLGRAQAARLCGLDADGVERLEALVRRVADVLAERAARAGLELADGVVELGLLGDGEPIVLGTPGTPDSARHLLGGLHAGKQVIRDYYRQQGLERDLREWRAAGRPRSAWPDAAPLPMGFVVPLADMYRSLCAALANEPVPGAPALEDAVELVQLLTSNAIRW